MTIRWHLLTYECCMYLNVMNLMDMRLEGVMDF